MHQIVEKEHSTLRAKENLLASRFRQLKSSLVALGVRPGLLSLPYIVNVFPDPVCPYANIQTLNPSIADWTKYCTHQHT